MRSALKMTLVAASLAAAFTASAQPGSANRPAASAPATQSVNSPTPARNARRAMRHQPLTPEQRQARFDSATAQQAKILQITVVQRPQWDAYVQAKKSMFDSMGSHRDTMRRQDVDRMTADQRTELHAQHMEAAARHMRLIADRTKALRNVLTPEQRMQFDQMCKKGPRFGGAQGMMHRGWGNQESAAPLAKP